PAADARSGGSGAAAPAGVAASQIRRQVAALAPGGEDRVERRQEEDGRRRVTAERLLEREIRRLAPELACPQRLQAAAWPPGVGPRRETLDGVDDHVEIDEAAGHVGGDRGRGRPQRVGEL